MFSSACQGLQLCLEPKVVESHIFRLKLAPPIINLPGTIETPTVPESMSYNEEKNTNITDENNSNDCKLIGHRNTDMGGWSFIQSLASSKDSTEGNEIYVHPLVKSTPFTTLSEKSLELCTESLGSETGSYNIPLREIVDCNTSKPREDLMTKRMSRSSSFPPPLMSISGSNGVQVMSHREGGRLVVQAVNVPSCQAYFHTERSEGRLRLCLLKDTTTPILDDDMDREREKEQEDEVVEDVVVNEENGVIEDDVVYEENGVIEDDVVYEENGVIEDDVVYEENGVVEDEVVYEVNGVVEGEVEEEKCHSGDEDVNEKSGNVGGEIGKGNFARPSSCKERGCGRKGLLHWDPYIVAT